MKTCNFVPVEKIINIINSCQTKKQLKSCKKVIKNYINQLKHQGVINYNDLERYLFVKYDIVNDLIEQKNIIVPEKKKKRQYKKSKEQILVH